MKSNIKNCKREGGIETNMWAAKANALREYGVKTGLEGVKAAWCGNHGIKRQIYLKKISS